MLTSTWLGHLFSRSKNLLSEILTFYAIPNHLKYITFARENGECKKEAYGDKQDCYISSLHL